MDLLTKPTKSINKPKPEKWGGFKSVGKLLPLGSKTMSLQELEDKYYNHVSDVFDEKTGMWKAHPSMLTENDPERIVQNKKHRGMGWTMASGGSSW